MNLFATLFRKKEIEVLQNQIRRNDELIKELNDKIKALETKVQDKPSVPKTSVSVNRSGSSNKSTKTNVEERVKREERINQKEEEKRQEFINEMWQFLAHHGTPKTDVDALLNYIKTKTRSNFNSRAVWTAEPDQIMMVHNWSAHSFFDDGPGVQGHQSMSISFVGNEEGEYCIENEKLNDMTYYSTILQDSCSDLFYVKNPFGLRGIFKIKYSGYEITTY